MKTLIKKLKELGYQTVRTWFGLRVFSGNGYELLVIHEEERIVEFTQENWDRDFEVLEMVIEYMRGEEE